MSQRPLAHDGQAVSTMLYTGSLQMTDRKSTKSRGHAKDTKHSLVKQISHHTQCVMLLTTHQHLCVTQPSAFVTGKRQLTSCGGMQEQIVRLT